MTTYSFSALAASQHLSFNPAVDVLQFDATGSTASAAAVWLQSPGLGISYGGMTFEKISSTKASYAGNEANIGLVGLQQSGVAFV